MGRSSILYPRSSNSPDKSVILRIVFLPVLVIALAAIAVAVPAYGTAATWAQFDHGIAFILWSRRFQWPLLATALALCLVLLVIVVSGRQRAWWLIGLLPILAIFCHRFVTGAEAKAAVIENPVLTDADHATFLHDDDYVVGMRVGGVPCAFPYAVLYSTPAVISAQRNARVILLWSPQANKATAVSINGELRGRDLEVVSMPGNALLVYNSRVGQFINGITARTPGGVQPAGFGQALPTIKEMWADWREQNPQTQVMAPMSPAVSDAPAVPLLPSDPMPPSAPHSAEHRQICIIPATQPIAIPSDAITETPLNLSAGSVPVLVMRDPLTGQVLAFDRHVESDLIPRFASIADPRRPNAALIDVDSNTEWTDAGAAISGQGAIRRGQLTPLRVEDGLYWDVMKYWYPNLKLIDSGALAAAVQPSPIEIAQDSRAGNNRYQNGRQNQGNNRRRRFGN